jgi:hypothetical protein
MRRKGVIMKNNKDDEIFSNLLTMMANLHEEVRKDLKSYEKVCIYDFKRELAESLIIRLEKNDNIKCKYIHDGTHGFLKRIDLGKEG